MKKILFLTMLIFALEGCVATMAVTGVEAVSSAADGRSIGSQIDDTTLKARLKAALFGEKGFPSSKVSVYVFDNVVFLVGVLDSESLKVWAKRIIKEHTSAEVIDYLQVGPYDYADYANDLKLTATVKAKLFKDKVAPYSGISIETINEEVYVFGKVSAPEKLERIESIISGIPSVKSMNNNITVNDWKRCLTIRIF